MRREPRLNPLDRPPATCPCGALAARAEIVAPLCHVCRMIASRHPEWSAAEVATAGAHRWLVLALRGVRRLALAAPGEPREHTVNAARLAWMVREGYERLTIRGGDEHGVLAALPEAWPELEIAARHEGGGALALKLVGWAGARAQEVAA